MTRIDCREITSNEIIRSEQIRVAFDCLAKFGYVIMDNLVAEEKIKSLRAEVKKRLTKYIDEKGLRDELRVGSRRYMIPVEISGKFSDPLIYANDFVVSLVRLALGKDAILESFGAVISLPGSETQHIHRDGPLLFDFAISTILPVHALTYVLPLIEMNDHHGSTAIWPGSHRWTKFDSNKSPEIPTVPLGSCILWDYRLFHGGTPNRSSVDRPIVYGTYSKKWFQDRGKKGTQRQISFENGFIENLNDENRRLFSHMLNVGQIPDAGLVTS